MLKNCRNDVENYYNFNFPNIDKTLADKLQENNLNITKMEENNDISFPQSYTCFDLYGLFNKDEPYEPLCEQPAIKSDQKTKTNADEQDGTIIDKNIVSITIPKKTRLHFEIDDDYDGLLWIEYDTECNIDNNTMVTLGNTVFKLNNINSASNQEKQEDENNNELVYTKIQKSTIVSEDKNINSTNNQERGINKNGLVYTTLKKGTIVSGDNRIPFELGTDFKVIINNKTNISVSKNVMLTEIESGAKLRFENDTIVNIV